MNPRQIPVPICLWRDAGGLVGGCLAERPEIAAVGENPKEIQGQLQAWIDWYYDEYPWAAEPDFFEPELKQFAVEVYPEYRIKEKIYPLAEVMVLAVPCLIGRNGAGQSLVSLPLQKQLFHCYEPEAVKKLVAHYVQQELRGNTPAQLSRQLAPPEIWTGKLTCKSRGERPESAEELPEVLVSVAEPIGDRAARRQFGRAWEREDQVRQLCQWLTDEQSNILLVGEAGVGKSTLLAEAVREVERNRTGTEARTKKLPRHWLTSAGRLIAGMQYLGQWQQRCEELVSALAEIKGVLCAESLMGLVRTGGSGPIDSLAAFFQPFLQYGELRMIAEASPAELDACRRLMPGLADQFRILSVPPLERAAALKVMERLQRQQQQEGGPEIEKGTLEQVWHLFRRFAPYSPFPGQPVRFLQQLFEKTRPPAKLGPLDAVRLFSQRTGLPERLLRDDQPLGYAEVLSNLQAKVLGQPAACELAARILTLFKAGLNDPARPLGVLLFCGPTGVGKTALARAMADFLQGGRLIRLDMSEYAGPFAATRLVTGADGEPAQWLQRIRQQPFQLLLLDEIEKADAAVFDVLLGLFDEGRLTDSYGRVLHFQSSLIVMTSNLGAEAPAALGFGAVATYDHLRAVQDFFRPEFFNRLDAVVPFASLGPAQVAGIAELELQSLAQREGLVTQGLELLWTSALVAHLAAVGFDARYGARPLQRAIEREVTVPLAHFLLQHPELKKRTLRLDLEQGALRIGLDESRGPV